MGRIGDNDVHAAYVEFRAKESDKVIISFPPIPSPSLRHPTVTVAIDDAGAY